MKNQKGITLIALVITIIVLLILAGVAIAMLSGDNGILTNATKSSYYNRIGETKDKIALTVNEAVTVYLDYVHNTALAADDETTKTYDFPATVTDSIQTAITADDATANSVVTAAIESYTSGGDNKDQLPSETVVVVTEATEKTESAEAKDATVKITCNNAYTVTGTITSNGVKWGNIEKVEK